eukprot:11613013-Alexandrium_andersonii.AAC.1
MKLFFTLVADPDGVVKIKGLTPDVAKMLLEDNVLPHLAKLDALAQDDASRQASWAKVIQTALASGARPETLLREAESLVHAAARKHGAQPRSN